MVPADARLICDYNTPASFAQYKAEMASQDLSMPRAKAEEGEEEEDGKHIGHAILAVDQSAMTGESLAVEKCECCPSASPSRKKHTMLTDLRPDMTDSVYYTTGCKRGSVPRSCSPPPVSHLLTLMTDMPTPS